MFALVLLNDDRCVSVDSVYGPYHSEEAAVAAGQGSCPEAVEEDEDGRWCDEDGLALFQVVPLMTPPSDTE